MSRIRNYILYLPTLLVESSHAAREMAKCYQRYLNIFSNLKYHRWTWVRAGKVSERFAKDDARAVRTLGPDPAIPINYMIKSKKTNRRKWSMISWTNEQTSCLRYKIPEAG